MSQLMISITFSYQHYVEDLSIPNYWSVEQLMRELSLIFHFDVPISYHLLIKNKQLLLSSQDQLNQYPISNGDIFSILEV